MQALGFFIHAKPSEVCLNTNSSPTSSGASPCLRKDPILVFWALNGRQAFPRWIYVEDRAQPWNFVPWTKPLQYPKKTPFQKTLPKKHLPEPSPHVCKKHVRPSFFEWTLKNFCQRCVSLETTTFLVARKWYKRLLTTRTGWALGATAQEASHVEKRFQYVHVFLKMTCLRVFWDLFFGWVPGFSKQSRFGLVGRLFQDVATLTGGYFATKMNQNWANHSPVFNWKHVVVSPPCLTKVTRWIRTVSLFCKHGFWLRFRLDGASKKRKKIRKTAVPHRFLLFTKTWFQVFYF